MSNINSIPNFNSASLKELQDATGITQFVSETNWYHTISGLLIQGGLIVAATHAIPSTVIFNVGFPKQVLGVFCQELGTHAHGHSIANVTLTQFELILAAGPDKDFYWWAIGV